MLFFVTAVKLVAEIGLMAFIGRFILGLLAGAKRDSNLFYGILSILTRPFERLTRLITPRVVIDRHIPLAAFLLLAAVWIFATLSKIRMCVELGVQVCR
jgi:hypothetical protein